MTINTTTSVAEAICHCDEECFDVDECPTYEQCPNRGDATYGCCCLQPAPEPEYGPEGFVPAYGQDERPHVNTAPETTCYLCGEAVCHPLCPDSPGYEDRFEERIRAWAKWERLVRNSGARQVVSEKYLPF